MNRVSCYSSCIYNYGGVCNRDNGICTYREPLPLIKKFNIKEENMSKLGEEIMGIDRKLIYVAAKYSGSEKNKELVEKAIKYFIKTDNESLPSQDKTYISPIHTFTFLYDNTEYFEGLDYCLSLLDKCDECYMLSNWKDSFGAKIEYGFCKGKGIPIKIIDINEIEWSDFE